MFSQRSLKNILQITFSIQKGTRPEWYFMRGVLLEPLMGLFI